MVKGRMISGGMMSGGMVSRRLVAGGLGLAGLALLAGCGDDEGSGTPSPPYGGTSTGPAGGGLAGGGYTVLGALREIPGSLVQAQPSDQLVLISTADLVVASEQSVLDRPAADADVPEWAAQLGGARTGGRAPLFVALAEIPGMIMAAQTPAVRSDLGWSVLDVKRFVSFSGAPPGGRFVAVSGERLGPDTLKALPTVKGEIRTAGQGEDFAVDLKTRTPARPLGSPLRMAARGSTIAASPATPAVEGWLAASRSAADDADLAAVAGALDSRRTVSAVLAKPNGAGGVAGPRDSGPRPSVSADAIPAPRALGIGWRAEDGEARVVLGYAYGSDAEAAAALPRIESAWRSGTAVSSSRPLRDLVTVDAAEADGKVVVLASRPTSDAPTSVYYQMLIRGEPVLSGR